MDSPYKGLIPYAEEDFDYFFGRDTERRIISANLCASRLTLLYGESGVGKSSLLNAAVAHKLRNDSDYVVFVFSTWQIDPVEEVKRALSTAIPELGQILEAMVAIDLVAGIRTWINGLKIDDRRTLLIILDQFEDLLYYHPAISEKLGDNISQSFTEQLPRLIAAADLPVNFLVSIREDCLALLDRFKSSIPRLFDNYLRVEHLSLRGAKDAILMPVEKFNRNYPNRAITMPEPREELADLVINGITQAQSLEERFVQAPSLQLVMSQWWQAERVAGSRELKRQTFVAMGGVHDIVANYLTRIIDERSDHQPETVGAVAALFDKLVTPTGRKSVRTFKELVAGTRLNDSNLADLLEYFRAARILTPAPPPREEPNKTELAFEFAHDLMAKAAAEWIEKYEQAQRIAQAEREKVRAEQEAVQARRQAKEMLRLKEAAEAAQHGAEKQLQAMGVVYSAIAEKGPDLKGVLERLLQQTLELTGAKYGACMQWQHETLEPVAFWPFLGGRHAVPLREDIALLAARSKKSILVEDVKDEKLSLLVEPMGEIFPARVYTMVNPIRGACLQFPC